LVAFDPLPTFEFAVRKPADPAGDSKMRELNVPAAAQTDDDSWELLRAWVAENGLHCSLKVGVYEAEGIQEEKAWGTILADAARHVADALSSLGLRNSEAALSEIRRHFEAELDAPTSKRTGSLVQ
jgi:hypothetical protein